MTFYQMLRLLTANHDAIIANIIPMDREGMRVYPTPNTIVAALEAAITPDLGANDWIVTSNHDGNVLIEPQETRRIAWRESSFHYHVSDRANQPTILQDGLALHTGGNTTMHRNYPARIYLARNLLVAIEFVEFQCKDKYSSMPAAMLAAMGIVPKQRAQLDIWLVDLQAGTEIHADILFPGVAGWIDVPIPADRVKLVSWWPGFEEMWDMQRKAGIV